MRPRKAILGRLASQYGQRLDLGGNLYNWFVRNLSESAVMLETLLDEIACSPLQYTFEHSIGLAISYQLREGSVRRLKFLMEQKPIVPSRCEKIGSCILFLICKLGNIITHCVIGVTTSHFDSFAICIASPPVSGLLCPIKVHPPGGPSN